MGGTNSTEQNPNNIIPNDPAIIAFKMELCKKYELDCVSNYALKKIYKDEVKNMDEFMYNYKKALDRGYTLKELSYDEGIETSKWEKGHKIMTKEWTY